MKSYKDFNIMTKILAGFILVAILSGMVGAFGIGAIKTIGGNGKLMFEKLNSPMQLMTTLTENYYKMRIIINESLGADNDSYMKTRIARVAEHKSSIYSINKSLENRWTEEQQDTVEQYNNAINRLFPMIDDLVAAVQKGDRQAAIAQYKSVNMETAFTNMEFCLNSLVAAQIYSAKTQADQNNQIESDSLKWMVLVLILSFLLSIAVGVFISINISKPIKNLTSIANKLAMGEVDVYVGETSNDEVGILSKAFINMINNVNSQAECAQKIAAGDLNLHVDSRSENDVLSNSMILVIDTLNNMMLEVDYLLSEAKKDNYSATGDAEKFTGAYKNIVEGINNTVAAVREKIYWYEAILDSIPFPISVTDIQRNVTFVNKPVEEMLGSKRKEMLGKQCSSCWNANICNTENCGIEKLENNQPRTVFNHEDLNFQVDSSYLYNTSGQAVGHIELIQDITARSRVLSYQKQEVDRLSKNLKLLAEGNLKLDLTVSEGDKYTTEERSNFIEINQNVSLAIDSISDYIKDITHILNQMAEGNLNVSVASDYKGDFVEIKHSLNSIITSFNEVVNEINSSADQVSAGSRQVADGSQALSQGATEQASSIEELTASITEVAAQIKQNALSANEANQLSSKARSDASKGAEEMKEMLVSMENINEACKKIAKIIKVIDEIAFQTNILALNASVEAARAGQHGKGFSVVAEEVRNLAGRSANAAKETEIFIENSLVIVEEGTKKANKTSDALNTIVEGIQQASSIVEDISRASDEQANAITQINNGIEQVSRVVQTNSSTAEESAAASEELSNHANMLKDLVGRFITNKSTIVPDIFQDRVDSLFPSEDIQKESMTEKLPEGLTMVKINLGEDDFGKY